MQLLGFLIEVIDLDGEAFDLVLIGQPHFLYKGRQDQIDDSIS
jgi:hypothetical protein